MGKIITTPLPKDLPENWNDAQFVSPGGVEVGLSEKHGYNYLMKQVNATQKALEELDEGVAPAGFGLGEQFAVTEVEDANLIDKIGFYACRVNTPDTNWWFGVHIQYSPGYAYQKFCRTIAAAAAERWCVNGTWTAWERIYSTAFKPTPDEVGAAPVGLVTVSMNKVLSPEDLDARLTQLFDSMPNATMRYVRATFQVAHPVLGGEDRMFEIFRANVNYGTLRAVTYSTTERGVFVEHRRSLYNRAWTDWAKVSGDIVVPATME